MSDKQKTMLFDEAMTARLQIRYDRAVRDGEDQFTFEGHEFLTAYAVHLLEYLDTAGNMRPGTASAPDWQRRMLEACGNNRSQYGAILMCVFGVTGHLPPRFEGGAFVTSDGFVMCSYTEADGRRHTGAFVGALDDVVGNTVACAKHCGLTDAERAELYSMVNKWLGLDVYGRIRDYFKT